MAKLLQLEGISIDSVPEAMSCCLLGEDSSKDHSTVIDFVENDLCNEVTKLVPNMLHGKKTPESIKELRVMLASLSPEAKRAIPQAMRLMKLLLTVPLSSAAAERSFCHLGAQCLRRD